MGGRFSALLRGGSFFRLLPRGNVCGGGRVRGLGDIGRGRDRRLGGQLASGFRGRAGGGGLRLLYRLRLLGRDVLIVQNLPQFHFVQLLALALGFLHADNAVSGGLIAQVKQVQNGFLSFGLQRGHFGCGGNGELALVNQVAHALDCLRHTDQAVELGDGHAHFLRQLRVALQLICGKAFLSAARLLLHALHLHPQGAGQVIAGNFVPVQVAVRHDDLGVRVANFLDNGGNGLIEHGGSNMAALAGQDFQPALFVEPGQHRVFDAHQFNGFQKLLEVLAFNIHGKIVVAGFLQIGRVEGDKIGLALFRGGQSFPRRLVRGREALLKNLRDSSPGRSLLGGGQGFALILTGRVCLCRTAFLGLSLRFVSIGEVSQGRRQHLLR